MTQPYRKYAYEAFREFHDSAFENMERKYLIKSLSTALMRKENRPNSNLIVLELSSFVSMVDSIKEQRGNVAKPAGYISDGIGIGKTIVDSIKELAGLDPMAKLGLKLYSELLDIIKGFLGSRK